MAPQPLGLGCLHAPSSLLLPPLHHLNLGFTHFLPWAEDLGVSGEGSQGPSTHLCPGPSAGVGGSNPQPIHCSNLNVCFLKEAYKAEAGGETSPPTPTQHQGPRPTDRPTPPHSGGWGGGERPTAPGGGWRPGDGRMAQALPRGEGEQPTQTPGRAAAGTLGGRILQMPVFSARPRMRPMKPRGSPNSSQLGSKTGHSGGGTNSAA